MSKKKAFFMLGLAGTLALLFPLSQVLGAAGPKVDGVWECPVIRTGSTPFFVYQTFHADGTMSYSSGSDIFAPGCSSRGGGQGVWKKMGPNLYRFKAIENLYRNVDEGNGPAGFRDKSAGRFFVDQIFHYDSQADTLCSGNGGALAGCPSEATTIVHRESFACDLPPDGHCDDFTASPVVRCNRLESVFPDLR